MTVCQWSCGVDDMAPDILYQLVREREKSLNVCIRHMKDTYQLILAPM